MRLDPDRSEVLEVAPPLSPARRALRIDVEGVDRSGGGHEEPVSLLAAEAEVGAALRQPDAADQLALRREHDHAVELLAHAPSAPEIAVDVSSEAIGGAVAAVVENPVVGEFGPAIHDVVDADQAVRRRARFNDVELGFVRRKAEPVGALYITGDCGRQLGAGIDAVDVAGQFRLRHGLVGIGAETRDR